MRECSPDSGLARSRRPRKQHAALGLQAQFRPQRIVFEWQCHLHFELMNYIINTFQVAPTDLLYFLQLHIACHIVRAQILDEDVCVQVLRARQPVAGIPQLLGRQCRGEPVNASAIELALCV